MIITTTGSVEGKTITAYHGVVAGEAVMGTNFVRDFFAKVTDKIGGRSDAYQKEIKNARGHALEDIQEEAEELGANAIVGVSVDVEVIGDSMLMVVVSGTAVSVS
ncbi:heavy metal-binding domain-containing protein [Sneathiella marina]|uniref:UPF0145 protein NBZ79_19215 n=1 Tax=Sneathiella marina TaxID=2950108 RepID=A0ABY4W398_9PROT|nr:YbjQ family protein [Sneathiella marina]USG61291.1 heavy metal-binding domain-containing protein [Sneathiella marina]